MDELSTGMRPPEDTIGSPAPQGIAELYQEHSRMVLSAAFRVTGSRQDAEDVVQTVFLRLTRRWQEIELTEPVGAYLRRAAVNGSLDLLRSRARGGSIPLDDLALEPADAGAVSTERRTHDGEFRRELRQALLDIPEQRARVFVLRYFEGLSNGEIATLLGMRRVAVGVTLHRTRRQLQGKLQQFVEGGL